MKRLFSSAQLGNITLSNRVVMAPMTRSRAMQNIPNDLMVKYYSDRASAGLIITEGTSPSPNGLGYPRIPGLFNLAQVQGWKKVTDAVHAKGGRIFIQLMHTGRVSHLLNMPAGAQVLAPSSSTLGGTMWTDSQGAQVHSKAKEMTLEEIKATQEEYVRSAELAIQAGFDGVEMHAANGYLMEQFLNPNVNHRTDAYGKTAEGRMKFVLEIVEAAAKRIGADKIGIRVSPYGVFNETGAFEGIDQFYGDFAKKLSALKIAYMHVVDHTSMGAPAVSNEVKVNIRNNFKGVYILSGGYNSERAEVDLIENKGDLVAFGRPFIANPDLVEKLKSGAALKTADHNKFYTPGADGYTEV